MGSQPAASMSDFPRCTWIGAPVARAPACAGVRATRSVGILSPDFFPMYLIGAPVAWASAHAEGRAGLPCPPSRWSGGSRAPLFRSMRTWGGRRLRRRGRAPGGSPLSGQPDRREGKRTGVRADAAAYATPIRAVRGPEPKARGGPGGRVSGRRVQGCRLCRPRPRKRA